MQKSTMGFRKKKSTMGIYVIFQRPNFPGILRWRSLQVGGYLPHSFVHLHYGGTFKYSVLQTSTVFDRQNDLL
jgi:hypothetical protein